MRCSSVAKTRCVVATPLRAGLGCDRPEYGGRVGFLDGRRSGVPHVETPSPAMKWRRRRKNRRTVGIDAISAPVSEMFGPTEA